MAITPFQDSSYDPSATRLFTLPQLQDYSPSTRAFFLNSPKYQDITDDAPDMIPIKSQCLIPHLVFSVFFLTTSERVIYTQPGGYLFSPSPRRHRQREHDLVTSTLEDVAKKRYGVDCDLAMASLPILSKDLGKYYTEVVLQPDQRRPPARSTCLD